MGLTGPGLAGPIWFDSGPLWRSNTRLNTAGPPVLHFLAPAEP
jgi:hypothetical protein